MKYQKTTIFISLLIVFLFINYLQKNETPNILFNSLSSKSQEKNIKDNAPKNISILAFGDLMLGRYVETLIFRGENMFENIRGTEGNFFKGMDYILTNLESPITRSEVSLEKDITLKMDPSNTYLLQENGINLVSLANNHTEDYLQQGLDDTIKYLDEYGIEHFGIQNQPLIIEKNGLKLAFFGINALWGDIKPYYKMVEDTKNKVDLIIVSVHWGEEYNSLPSKNQIEIGHKLIDSGATVILGHHPHTTQPVEKYKGGIIFYSLGNFIFDQLDPITKKELGVRMNIEKSRIYFHLFPMTVKNFKPELLSYEEATSECLSLTQGIVLDDNCMFNLETN